MKNQLILLPQFTEVETDSEGAIFVKSSFLDDETILNSKCFWLSD